MQVLRKILFGDGFQTLSSRQQYASYRENQQSAEFGMAMYPLPPHGTQQPDTAGA